MLCRIIIIFVNDKLKFEWRKKEENDRNLKKGKKLKLFSVKASIFFRTRVAFL